MREIIEHIFYQHNIFDQVQENYNDPHCPGFTLNAISAAAAVANLVTTTFSIVSG